MNATGLANRPPELAADYRVSVELIDDIREGRAFQDAAHQIHTVSRNASQTEPLRFVIAYTVKQGEQVTVFPG